MMLVLCKCITSLITFLLSPILLLFGWLSWNKYSDNMLRSIEKKILQYCTTTYRGWFVDVGPVVSASDRIWTISMNVESKQTPLVMLHGLGSGVALWCMNLDALAANRPVYAFDILGFGRSSRPNFSADAVEAEMQLVKSIEEWRKEMKLEKFVLLGHSMGGFLAASYALSHPERVKHLVLADPWGFPERQLEPIKPNTPLWIKALAYTLQPLNPLWAIRAAGPLGQWLIGTVRPDIARKFSILLKEEDLITQYLYQCNAQHPSGESAFHAMMTGIGWAKHPMVNRIDQLDKNVPITLMYGTRSWIDNSAGEIIKEKRHDAEVNLQAIVGAGHHIYADKPEIFNTMVLEVCEKADKVSTDLIRYKKPIPQVKITDDNEQPHAMFADEK